LGNFCISVSGQVNEPEGIIYLKKVDELRSTRRTACPDQVFSLNQAIDERGFADVRPAGERHLGRFIPWVLVGMHSGCDEFSRLYDEKIFNFIHKNSSNGQGQG